jgi:hypothetical protein
MFVLQALRAAANFFVSIIKYIFLLQSSFLFIYVRNTRKCKRRNIMPSRFRPFSLALHAGKYLFNIGFHNIVEVRNTKFQLSSLPKITKNVKYLRQERSKKS